MHLLVKEHLEKIILFLEDGYDNPEYKVYSNKTQGLSIVEYSNVFQKVDLLGKIALVIKAIDWFDDEKRKEFFELNKDVIQFRKIIELVFLVNIPNDRIKNIPKAISLLEEFLRDKIRVNVIDEILS